MKRLEPWTTEQWVAIVPFSMVVISDDVEWALAKRLSRNKTRNWKSSLEVGDHASRAAEVRKYKWRQHNGKRAAIMAKSSGWVGRVKFVSL